jgi:adenosine deaminase CECR1
MADLEEKLDDLNLEDEAWHDAEGVPRFTDPFIQQYLNGRDNLVRQEKTQRSG